MVWCVYVVWCVACGVCNVLWYAGCGVCGVVWCGVMWCEGCGMFVLRCVSWSW